MAQRKNPGAVLRITSVTMRTSRSLHLMTFQALFLKLILRFLCGCRFAYLCFIQKVFAPFKFGLSKLKKTKKQDAQI